MTARMPSSTRPRARLDVAAVNGLHAIAADPPAHRRSRVDIGLRLPGLTDAESAMWEQALNRPLRSSGTTLAWAFMLSSVTVYLGSLAATQSTLSLAWPQVLVGAAVVLGGAALGKVVGLFYWNIVLARTARRLARLAGESRQILTGAQSVTFDSHPTRPFHSSAVMT